MPKLDEQGRYIFYHFGDFPESEIFYMEVGQRMKHGSIPIAHSAEKKVVYFDPSYVKYKLDIEKLLKQDKERRYWSV